MIWGPRPKLRIAPPMGREYQQFTFWLITFEQSVRKLKYLCLWIPCVCRIRRCQLCQDWLNPLSAILKCVIHFHIFWTIWHIVTKIGRDHQHHVLDVPQKYEDSATYCSRDITILEKMLTFKILSQICTFDVILFPGLCWFWKCLICHFPKQRLSAVLK